METARCFYDGKPRPGFFFYLLTRWIFMCWTKKKIENLHEKLLYFFFYDLTNFPFGLTRCLSSVIIIRNHNITKLYCRREDILLCVCDLLVSFQCLIARGRPSLVNESAWLWLPVVKITPPPPLAQSLDDERRWMGLSSFVGRIDKIVFILFLLIDVYYCYYTAHWSTLFPCGMLICLQR